MLSYTEIRSLLGRHISTYRVLLKELNPNNHFPLRLKPNQFTNFCREQY